MKFESQICTTQEQSQRLLSMGVKPETADMVYHFTGSRVEVLQCELQAKPPTLRGSFWTKERIAKLSRGNQSGEEVFDKLWGKDVPAWSLSRLMEMIPGSMTFQNTPYIFALFHDDDNSWTASYCGAVYITKESPYEACISMIEKVMQHNEFNKEVKNENRNRSTNR